MEVHTHGVERRPYVFISYARDDAELVKPIVARLIAAGVSTWIDTEGIPGGTNYGLEIVDGIRECQLFILMSSAAALTSRNVEQEVKLAWKYDRPYLPLLLDPTPFPTHIEYWLEGTQWVEILDRPDDEWLPQTLAAIRGFMVATTEESVALESRPDMRSGVRPSVTARRADNLPDSPTSFVGRTRERETLHALFRASHTPRLVTLTGPGGAGKTRLGVQLGTELLETFPEGICFVPLAPITNPELVAPTIAKALQLREVAGQPILDSVRQYLQSRRMLLILDNVEQVIDAAPVVAELLRDCPRLHVLVTSRMPLHVTGEHEFTVAPLDLPDPRQLPPLDELAQTTAIALFVERARAVKPQFELTPDNAAATVEICRRLDGLPLAIELAAARIKLLSPQALLVRLERRLPLLTGGARGLPERQQTIRNAIAWSYDLLTETERRLYRQLSVFAGGWSLEAAVAVADSDELTVLDDLTSLVDKSLIQQVELDDGEVRFRMLAMIQEFGAEQLEATDEAVATLARHATYFRDRSERFLDFVESDALTSSAQLIWYDELERDHDNYRKCLEWAVAHDPDGVGLTLVAALARFWYDHCHFHEGYRWLTAILDRAAPVVSLPRAFALRSQGMIGWEMYREPKSEARVKESLDIVRQLDAARSIWFGLGLLAVIALYDDGDVERADALLDEARMWDLRANTVPREPNIPIVRGVVARLRGDPDRAEEQFREGLELARGRRLYSEYFASCYWGWLELVLGRYDQAAALAEQATEAARRFGHTIGVVEGVRIFACVATEIGEHERAVRLFAAADRVKQEQSLVYNEELPQDRDRADALLARSRAELGEDAYLGAWESGRALSLDTAVSDALAGARI